MAAAIRQCCDQAWTMPQEKVTGNDELIDCSIDRIHIICRLCNNYLQCGVPFDGIPQGYCDELCCSVAFQ